MGIALVEALMITLMVIVFDECFDLALLDHQAGSGSAAGCASSRKC